MKQLASVSETRDWRDSIDRGRSVGFVPTMGALHAGHEALIARARRECDVVAVSIFVNPTQFNDPDDCAKYPQPLVDDLTRCEAGGVDLVFTPTHDRLYPDSYRYRVTENRFSLELEGEFRPGHFDGVLTVVLKLLQIVRPDRSYFGEKDWQQLQLVKGMAEAFFLPGEIVPCPTVREADGLALSSRNVRLSREGRRKAAAFPRILRESPDPEAAQSALTAAGFSVEYVRESGGRRLGAVVIDGVRLIDNIPLQALGAKGNGNPDGEEA